MTLKEIIALLAGIESEHQGNNEILNANVLIQLDPRIEGDKVHIGYGTWEGKITSIAMVGDMRDEI